MRFSFITLLVPLSLSLFSLSSSKQWSKKITLGGWRLSPPRFINTNYSWSITCYKESVGCLHCYHTVNLLTLCLLPIDLYQYVKMKCFSTFYKDGSFIFKCRRISFSAWILLSSNVFQYIVCGCLFQDKGLYCSTTGEPQGHGWTSYEPLRPSLSIYHAHSMIEASLRRVILQ